MTTFTHQSKGLPAHEYRALTDARLPDRRPTYVGTTYTPTEKLICVLCAFLWLLVAVIFVMALR